MKPGIDFGKIEVFLYAAESLSFSEAAKRLHLSQPTVSYHIKDLESKLGVELLERLPSGLRLTEAGQFLLPWARKLIRQSVEIQEIMSSLQEKIVGHIRIACSTTSGKYILPQLAARFHNHYPWVRITILSCTSEYVIPNLLEEQANLGVVSQETLSNELDVQEFFQDHIVLIVPKGHPWSLKQSIEPQELTGTPLIVREQTSGTRRALLTELGKFDIGLDDFNTFLEIGNAEAIVATVAAGYGISFVSKMAADCAIKRGDVVEVKVEGLALHRIIYMIRRKIETNRAQEVFWGFIHDPANDDLLQLPDSV
ncbi:MAG: LysR family transcriptional regulator [Anaerolineales bacterium]|nr:LysR family transcriptional regulator [Anaerolineales bacterium]